MVSEDTDHVLLRPRVDVKGGQQLGTKDKTGLNTDKLRKAHYLFLTDPREETLRFQCARQKYLKKNLSIDEHAELLEHHL